MRVFNISRLKVGGIWFLKIGRINISFSVSRAYRDFGGNAMVVNCDR